MARRVRKGEYSFVRVVKGEKAGRIGFYADDHGTDAEVYFNTCREDVEYPVPRPAWIPRKDLRRAHVLPLFWETWQRIYPEVTEGMMAQMGERDLSLLPRLKRHPGHRVRRGEYGPVLVAKGEHKGRVGYYDDDNEQYDRALVFFEDSLLHWGIWESAPLPLPVEMHHRWLRHTETMPPFLEEWRRKYPDFVYYVGAFTRERWNARADEF